MISNNKIMVAMSGGVDSAVSLLTLSNDYNKKNISGATMKLSSNKNMFNDIYDCINICNKIKVKYFNFDFKNSFNKIVVKTFINNYINGMTPNPCIVCNQFIKFNLLKNISEKFGYGKMATGHYCQIKKENNRYFLLKAKDLNKDQSYFLYFLTQNILANIVFPIGHLYKYEVRNIAKENNLINSYKKDSQDICFISKNKSYIDLIKSNYNGKICSGHITNIKNEIIGSHNGLFNYTIGQKKRLNINNNNKNYVIKKNIKNNILIVDEEKFLYTNKLIAYNVNFIAFNLLKNEIIVYAKIRSSQIESKAKIFPINENKVYVEFFEKQRGITNGQSIVFYDDNYVIGGGIIEIV